MKKNILITLALSSLVMIGCGDSDDTTPSSSTTKEVLGKALYSEKSLSLNRTQSCATCHNLDHGFIDERENGVRGAVSLGDDGTSLGGRNAPTAGYASFTPRFHFDETKKVYIGGQFLDGRASTLEDQAGGPPLNPVEMNMPSKQALVDRLLENVDYVASFKSLYGANIFEDTNATYKAMTEVIAAFERTQEFSSFDSKYDKYLRGEYDLSFDEELGLSLFFSEKNTNCNTCHSLHREGHKQEIFTNYQYENIGIPSNLDLVGGIDHGLRDNPTIKTLANASEHDGKFRVPSLRNIAVSGPYMHNGVFKDLKTVIEFYEHFHNDQRINNPETGLPWDTAEVNATVNVEELKKGKDLNDIQIQGLVSFLKILTDERYEHLIP